jgi:hypothetical protein
MHLELIRSAALIPTSAPDKALCTAVPLTVPNWMALRAYGGGQKRKVIRMFSLAYSEQAGL